MHCCFITALTCRRVRNFFARLPWNVLCLKPPQTWKESEARLNLLDVISSWPHLNSIGSKMVESNQYVNKPGTRKSPVIGSKIVR